MTSQSILLDWRPAELDGSLDRVAAALQTRLAGQQLREEVVLGSHSQLEVKNLLCFVYDNLVMQVRLLSGAAGLTALLRLDRTAGLLTLNLDAPALAPAGSRYKDGVVAGRWLFTGQNEVVSWAGEVAAGLGCEPGLLPALTRGLLPSPYLTPTDDRLVESGLQRVVHQEQSQYQHIQVECDALHWADTMMFRWWRHRTVAAPFCWTVR